MLYLEAQLSGLGATDPAFGEIVSGIQQLSPSVADDVLTLLSNRVPVLAASAGQPAAAAEGFTNFVAVTMEQLAALGIPTSEQTQNAADYIKTLPDGNYTLADVNDVGALEQAPSSFTAMFHFTVASAAAVPYAAGPGSNLAVLWPQAPVDNTGSAKPKKSMAVPIVGAVIGGGAGALIGGGVGAVIGAVGGYLIGNAAA